MPTARLTVQQVVDQFTGAIVNAVEAETATRIRAILASAFDRGAGLGTRPFGNDLARNGKKKPPRQLCPVPGCTNTAAPIFGMVCRAHKDLPKERIAKFRARRRAEKERAAKN